MLFPYVVYICRFYPTFIAVAYVCRLSLSFISVVYAWRGEEDEEEDGRTFNLNLTTPL